MIIFWCFLEIVFCLFVNISGKSLVVGFHQLVRGNSVNEFYLLVDWSDV